MIPSLPSADLSAQHRFVLVLVSPSVSLRPRPKEGGDSETYPLGFRRQRPSRCVSREPNPSRATQRYRSHDRRQSKDRGRARGKPSWTLSQRAPALHESAGRHPHVLPRPKFRLQIVVNSRLPRTRPAQRFPTSNRRLQQPAVRAAGCFRRCRCRAGLAPLSNCVDERLILRVAGGEESLAVR